MIGVTLIRPLNKGQGHSFWYQSISNIRLSIGIPWYNLQSHTVCELKTKFGDTDSVARMKQLVHIFYFGHLFK